MFHKSIRFRIQFWHSLLLIITTVGLSVTYYFYEKQNQIRRVDASLHNHSIRFLPLTDRYIASKFPDRFPRRPLGPNQQAGPNQRPGPNQEVGPNQQAGPNQQLAPQHPPGPNAPKRQGPPPQQTREDNPDQRRLPPPHARNPAFKGLPPLDGRVPDLNSELESAGLFVYVWDRENNPIFRSSNSPEEYPPFPDVSPEQMKPTITQNENLRAFVTTPRFGAVFVFAQEITPLNKEFAALRIKLVGLDFVIILVGITVGWLLTGRAIQPIHRINETALKIASGQRNKRIDSSITDCELGQLAEVLNETFDKLDHSFDQQVKFTADASHELRTPVAAMLTQIQLALSKDREVGEYKEHLLACQSQAVHMRNLLNSLLDLARSDSGEIEFLLADYDLSELVLECCEWLESLAAEKQVELRTELTSVTAQIDGLRMSQVLTNIISNAIRHSPYSGRILISLTANLNTATIAIQDQGPGIPEEAKDHIFERFYRASKSRTAREGSVGLGLAIAKTIVDKHKGKIKAESDSSGTTFTITLPLKP